MIEPFVYKPDAVGLGTPLLVYSKPAKTLILLSFSLDNLSYPPTGSVEMTKGL